MASQLRSLFSQLQHALYTPPESMNEASAGSCREFAEPRPVLNRQTLAIQARSPRLRGLRRGQRLNHLHLQSRPRVEPNLPATDAASPLAAVRSHATSVPASSQTIVARQ